MKIKLNVRSSAIEKINYSPDTKILTIFFNGGRAYDYIDCSSADVLKLVRAESVGKYFNKYIRDAHSAVKKVG